MILTIIVILFLICGVFVLRGFFGRKTQLTLLIQNAKVIRENIVALRSEGYVIGDGEDTKQKFEKHTLEIRVFSDSLDYDSTVVEKLHLVTESLKDGSHMHTYRLRANMTIIESYILQYLCSEKLKSLYPTDTVHRYYKGGYCTVITIEKAELARQNETIKKNKLLQLQNKILLLFSAYKNGDFLPPWIVENAVDDYLKLGYSSDEAKNLVVELMQKESLDVDTEYKMYTLPRTLTKTDFESALFTSQMDAVKHNIPTEDIVAFRMRCNPRESELSARTAIVATQILERSEV